MFGGTAFGLAANPHLGGYIPGGDEATWYPELWTWLVAAHDIRTMLDAGCGEGHAVDYFAALGVDAIGIDGVPQHHPQIVCHDYTDGPYIADPCDLVWSCEFVEHVAEQHVENFLQTFDAAPLVLITHAEPGQDGHHHVNCQPACYWIEKLAARGYRLDERLVRITRSLARANPNPFNHFARSGLVFVR